MTPDAIEYSNWKPAASMPDFANNWVWFGHFISVCVCVCVNILLRYAAAAAAKSLQSCLTLCYPIDSSPPGSPVPGILQARILEWAAVSFSDAWKWKVKVKSLSHVQPSVTPWTAALQAPLSMGFSRQEYWSGVPLPSPNYQPKVIIIHVARIRK